MSAAVRPIPEFLEAEVNANLLQQIGVDANAPFILRGSCRRWIQEVLQLDGHSNAVEAGNMQQQEFDEAALAAVERDLLRPQHDAGEEQTETMLNNVFVVPRSVGRRFKYFKQAVPGETVGSRRSMSFGQLLEHLPWRKTAARVTPQEQSHDVIQGSDADSEADEKEETPEGEDGEDVFVYVYGEPSPTAQAQLGFPCAALDPSVGLNDAEGAESACRPQQQRRGQQGQHEQQLQPASWSSGFTSTLVWIAPDGSRSPLHYDACEGFLHQLHGNKRVTLISPADCFEDLQPHPVGSPYDRQSQLASLEAIPPEVRSRLVFWTGKIQAGDTLYIPYAWWHEVLSAGVSVSISQRWNPAEEAVRALEVARLHLLGGATTPSQSSPPSPQLPPALARMMFEQAVELDPRLPTAVRRLLLNRSRQQGAAEVEAASKSAASSSLGE